MNEKEEECSSVRIVCCWLKTECPPAFPLRFLLPLLLFLPWLTDSVFSFSPAELWWTVTNAWSRGKKKGKKEKKGNEFDRNRAKIDRNETSEESEKPFAGSYTPATPRLQGHGMTHKVKSICSSSPSVLVPFPVQRGATSRPWRLWIFMEQPDRVRSRPPRESNDHREKTNLPT